MTDDSESSTRFQLTIYMLGAVVMIVIIVMLLGAFNIVIPEFVSGVVVMGFMTMLSKAYDSYFKAREEMQADRKEIAKAAEVAKAGVEETAEAVARAVVAGVR